MCDGSARRLSDQPRILCERTCTVTGRPRLPIASARREFLVVDQHIHPPVCGIDPDPVAIANKR